MALNEWEVYGDGFPLIREPLQQLPGGTCRFSALGRHVEYELRLAYGNASPAVVHLFNGELIDQAEMIRRYMLWPQRNTRLSGVLEFAKAVGIPLWNKHEFKIITYKENVGEDFEGENIPENWESQKWVNILMEWLEKGTVLATMNIFEDYTIKNDRVYWGQGENLLGTHSIVITGLRAHPREGHLFIYQDSRGPDNGGMLGRGRNLASLKVLLKIYQVVIPFPNELRPLLA